VTDRRTALKIIPIAVVALAVSGRVVAQGAPAARVDEADATAKALGYVHDAAKVDKAKYPKFAAGQNCANCQLFQGKSTDAWAGCPIFPGKQVAAKGWCSSWVKKA
jgi:hypothetical protein